MPPSPGFGKSVDREVWGGDEDEDLWNGHWIRVPVYIADIDDGDAAPERGLDLTASGDDVVVGDWACVGFWKSVVLRCSQEIDFKGH